MYFARVVSRPNRFVLYMDSLMTADFEFQKVEDVRERMMQKRAASLVKVHCPNTGRIAGLAYNQMQEVICLLSTPDDGADDLKHRHRKTRYTCEAMFLPIGPEEENIVVGINQVRANRYVEHFMETGQLTSLFQEEEERKEIRREVKIGQARIDFQVGSHILVEVKTLINKRSSKAISASANTSTTDRLIKHLNELSSQQVDETTGRSIRKIILLVHLYDAPPFQPPPQAASSNLSRVSESVSRASRAGVEWWQVNMQISIEGVRLLDHYPLSF